MAYNLEHLTPGPPRARTQAPTIYCYICGRQFGSMSIGIHQPQCLKKWQAQNDKLPKKLRKPVPIVPDVVVKGGKIDYEATNEAYYESSLAQLIPCENCGRKFAADPLVIHQRSCTKENPAKSLPKVPRSKDHQPMLATSMAKQRARAN